MSNRTRTLRRRIQEQREWIERCHASGVSYTDSTPSSVDASLTRGESIRQADESALAHLIGKLEGLGYCAGNDRKGQPCSLKLGHRGNCRKVHTRTTPGCEDSLCSQDAAFRVTIANLDGVVEESLTLCADCAAGVREALP